MKKTLVTFIITILILMAGITTVQGLSFGVKITPSSANVQKGDTVTLVLSVNNLDVGANGINTFLATLEYDQTVFNAVTENDINALNRWDAPTYNPGNGKILTAKGSFVNSESDVLEIKLTAKATAKTGNTTVTFKDIEASNSQTDIKVANTSYVLNITEKTSGEDNGGGTVVKPTVTAKYENVANGVKVTLTSDRELKAIAGWTLSADKKQLSKVYTENYNGTITVEDVDGNKSDAITLNVKLSEENNNNNGNNNSGTTTDKTKPTATVSYSKDATGKVTVTVTASEEIQPLAGWTLSADKKKLTKVYTENYSGTITITDLAGNKSDAITIKVDKSQENGGANSGNNNGNGGTANSELPKAGLEAYILPTILLIALAGTVAFIRYKSMEY